MDYLVKNIYGKIKSKNAQAFVPGSKSITARALLLAALARGQSILNNAQFSGDCATFLNCLKTLGIEYEVRGNTVKIQGCGGVLPKTKAELYVGSAGTAARFMCALSAFCGGEYTLTCSEQMQKRPVEPLINCLVSAGAQIQSQGGRFPLKITKPVDFQNTINVDVTQSSQFLSALLLAAPAANKPVKIKVTGSHGMDYVNMTLDMMWSFGVTVRQQGDTYSVGGEYIAKRYDIEPDLSAAAYFFAANRILGTEISVNGVMPHSMQGDLKFINLIKNFDGGRVDMSQFSDQALTMAAIAPYFSAPTEVCGVAHIRNQECDRISAAVHNLKSMGVRCEEWADGFKIYPSLPRPAAIETFGDHRVAMAFALTGLRADGIVIKNAEVCEKTFKDYFVTLDKLIEDLVK